MIIQWKSLGYHLAISTLYVLVFGTNEVDGIHHVLHARVIQPETTLDTPLRRLIQRLGSMPSTRHAINLPETAELKFLEASNSSSFGSGWSRGSALSSACWSESCRGSLEPRCSRKPAIGISNWNRDNPSTSYI